MTAGYTQRKRAQEGYGSDCYFGFQLHSGSYLENKISGGCPTYAHIGISVVHGLSLQTSNGLPGSLVEEQI